MGNRLCGEVAYPHVARAGSGRVRVEWQHPADKGSGDGRADGYCIQYIVDSVTQSAYDAAYLAFVPPPGTVDTYFARKEAAEMAAAAAQFGAGGVVIPPMWVFEYEENGPQEAFVLHVRGQGTYSFKWRGFKNHVRYRFGVAVETKGMGRTAFRYNRQTPTRQ